jgi:hypothetical protein
MKKQSRPSVTTFLQRAKEILAQRGATQSEEHNRGVEEALSVVSEVFQGTDLYNVQQQLHEAERELQEVSYQLAKAREGIAQTSTPVAGKAKITANQVRQEERSGFRKKIDRIFLSLVEPLDVPESERVASTLQLIMSWIAGGIINGPDMQSKETLLLREKYDAYKAQRKDSIPVEVIVKKVKRTASGSLEMQQRRRIAELEAILSRRSHWEKLYDRGLRRLEQLLTFPLDELRAAAVERPGLQQHVARLEALRNSMQWVNDNEEQSDTAAAAPSSE